MSGIWAEDLLIKSSQFTGKAFTKTLKEHHVNIIMDGRGSYKDKIMIERLWWAIKYQYFYLHSFNNGLSLRHGRSKWINGYNSSRAT